MQAQEAARLAEEQERGGGVGAKPPPPVLQLRPPASRGGVSSSSGGGGNSGALVVEDVDGDAHGAGVGGWPAAPPGGLLGLGDGDGLEEGLSEHESRYVHSPSGGPLGDHHLNGCFDPPFVVCGGGGCGCFGGDDSARASTDTYATKKVSMAAGRQVRKAKKARFLRRLLTTPSGGSGGGGGMYGGQGEAEGEVGGWKDGGGSGSVSRSGDGSRGGSRGGRGSLASGARERKDGDYDDDDEDDEDDEEEEDGDDGGTSVAVSLPPEDITSLFETEEEARRRHQVWY
jgi:hypothetical protein